MTPEQFEAKWGEALRSAGWEPAGMRETARTCNFARGILVRQAAERNCAVVQVDAMTSGHAWWQMQYITGTPVCDDEELYAEFDAALIAAVEATR